MPYLAILRTVVLLLAIAATLPATAAAEGRTNATPSAERLIRIDTGTGSLPTVAIAKGESVRLEVQTHTSGEFHLHGYDIVGVSGRDRVAVFVFTAAHTGRFAIVGHSHSHGGKDLLGRKETSVAYVEVRPR